MDRTQYTCLHQLFIHMYGKFPSLDPEEDQVRKLNILESHLPNAVANTQNNQCHLDESRNPCIG